MANMDIKTEFDEEVEISADYDPSDRCDFLEELDIKPEIFDPNEISDYLPSVDVEKLADIKPDIQPVSRRTGREVRARQFPDYHLPPAKKQRKARKHPAPAVAYEDVQDFKPCEPFFHPDFIVAEEPKWRDSAKVLPSVPGKNSSLTPDEKREAMREYQRAYREKRKDEERLKKGLPPQPRTAPKPKAAVAQIPKKTKKKRKRILSSVKRPKVMAAKREAQKEYYQQKHAERLKEKRAKNKKNPPYFDLQVVQPAHPVQPVNEERLKKKPIILKDFVTEIPQAGKIFAQNSSEFVMAVDIAEILQKNIEETEVPTVNEDVLLGIGLVDSDVEVVDEFRVTEAELNLNSKKEKKVKKLK